MPVGYTIDKTSRLITCAGQGVLTLEELAPHMRQLLAHPDFNPHYRQLWDLSAVSEITVSFPDMMKLAEVNVFAPTTRRAFLAPTNTAFGLARMFETLRQAKGETGIRVFRERAEALAWLEEKPVEQVG